MRDDSSPVLRPFRAWAVACLALVLVAGVSGGDAAGCAPDEEALALATRALDFVVTSSALAELWSQRDDADRWRARLDDLRLRLSL
jgi:hypothetical protein